MKTPHFLTLVLLLIVVVSCERPQVPHVKRDSVPEPSESISLDGATLEPPAEVIAPLEQATPASAPDREPEPQPVSKYEFGNGEPILVVKGTPTTITVSGSIKGFSQKKEIIRYLKEAFPEREIIDELEANPDRTPVGWGYRVSDGYLVPYFKTISKGVVRYKDRVVTLEGEVDSERMFRQIVSSAGDMFMGDFTEDIDSRNLVVRPQ